MSNKNLTRHCPMCSNTVGRVFKNVDGYDVVRCTQCRFVFVDIDNDVADDVNIFDGETTLARYYAREPIYSIAYYDATLKRLSNYLGKKQLRILDFGSGNGMFMRRARAAGHLISGVDVSPYAAQAKDEFDLDVQICDVRECTFDRESFDVVFSHATYEHISDPVGIGKVLAQFVRPGGLLVLSGLPNFQTVGIQVFKNFFNNGLGHVNHFERHALKSLMTTLDLDTVKLHSYGWEVWYLHSRYLQLSKKYRKNAQVNRTYAELIRNYDTYRPSTFEKIVSYVYAFCSPPLLGLSLEVWGKKRG